VDDYNSLYNYNQAFREPETTHFKPRKLRNSYLTLTRIFLDLHKKCDMVNGTFIGALTSDTTYRHFSEMTDSELCEWYKIPPYTIDETIKVIEHYERTKLILIDVSNGTREIIHQICSGRGKDIAKYCSSI